MTSESESEVVRGLLLDACKTTQVLSLRPGPSGYSSRLWLAETDEGPLLIRIPVRSVDHEHLRSMIVATRLASETGVPTVRFRAFNPNTRLGPVLIQEYRPGERASEFLKRNPERLKRISSTVGHWIGILHQADRQRHGGILGGPLFPSWAAQVKARVADALEQIDTSCLPDAGPQIIGAFEKAIGSLPDSQSASLVHADLYFDNVLVHDNEAVCLLDFEHAYYGDRFADFGKIRELMFELWPGCEEPFMAAYRQTHPEGDGDGARLRVALGLYELSQLAYFSRWQPDLVPFYRDRVNRWLTSSL